MIWDAENLPLCCSAIYWVIYKYAVVSRLNQSSSSSFPNKLPQKAQGHIYLYVLIQFSAQPFPSLQWGRLKNFISVTVVFILMLLHLVSCVSCVSLTVLGLEFISIILMLDSPLHHSPCFVSTQKYLSLYCKGTAIRKQSNYKIQSCINSPLGNM